MYDDDESDEDEVNYEKIGCVIYDDVEKFNKFNVKTVLLEIKENNFIIKHDVNDNVIDFDEMIFVYKNNVTNFMTYLMGNSKYWPDYKIYSLGTKKLCK